MSCEFGRGVGDEALDPLRAIQSWSTRVTISRLWSTPVCTHSNHCPASNSPISWPFGRELREKPLPTTLEELDALRRAKEVEQSTQQLYNTV